MGKASKGIRNAIFTLDIFGEPIGFSIDGKSSYKSVQGLVLSVGILATVLTFGVNKFLKCLDYQETLHQQSVSHDYFDASEEYKFEKFNAAFILYGSI